MDVTVNLHIYLMNDTVGCTYIVTECYRKFSCIYLPNFNVDCTYIVSECYSRLYIYSY